MSVQETADTIPREKWGNGQVVISERGKTGSWIMFDPEEDEVNLENWR